jgi:hypothetical protein
MSYVNCPRCRLTVRLRFDALAPEHCPRCEARHGVKEPVFLTPTPSRLFQRAPVVPTTRGPGRAPAAPA